MIAYSWPIVANENSEELKLIFEINDMCFGVRSKSWEMPAQTKKLGNARADLVLALKTVGFPCKALNLGPRVSNTLRGRVLIYPWIPWSTGM